MLVLKRGDPGCGLSWGAATTPPLRCRPRSFSGPVVHIFTSPPVNYRWHDFSWNRTTKEVLQGKHQGQFLGKNCCPHFSFIPNPLFPVDFVWHQYTSARSFLIVGPKVPFSRKGNDINNFSVLICDKFIEFLKVKVTVMNFPPPSCSTHPFPVHPHSARMTTVH